jgi:hypothetical protein
MKKSIHRDSNLTFHVQIERSNPLDHQASYIRSLRFLRVATALPIFIKFNISNKSHNRSTKKPYRYVL